MTDTKFYRCDLCKIVFQTTDLDKVNQMKAECSDSSVENFGKRFGCALKAIEKGSEPLSGFKVLNNL